MTSAKPAGAGADQITVARVQPAYAQVADQLRGLILRGEILPGQRLPVEAELSEMFGVGRSTIREALRALASQHLVVTKRGVHGGTFIVEPESSHVGAYLETSLGLLAGAEVITVDQLLEARALFEVPAARFAATRRSDEDLARLRSLSTGDGHAARVTHEFEENEGFHSAVLACSGNHLLQVMARPVFTVLQTRFVRADAPEAFWERVADDHQAIAQAVADQDPDASARLMEEHLDHLRSTYETLDVFPRSRSAVDGGSLARN